MGFCWRIKKWKSERASSPWIQVMYWIYYLLILFINILIISGYQFLTEFISLYSQFEVGYLTRVKVQKKKEEDQHRCNSKRCDQVNWLASLQSMKSVVQCISFTTCRTKFLSTAKTVLKITVQYRRLLVRSVDFRKK